MQIQSYHIHNVLNEYRKRLVQSPSSEGRSKASKTDVRDTVQLSQAGQRQAIIDQVSADIIERINQYGPQNNFDDTLAEYIGHHPGTRMTRKEAHPSEFIYTTIDENNRKTIQRFPINDFRPSIDLSGSMGNQEASEGTMSDGS